MKQLLKQVAVRGVMLADRCRRRAAEYALILGHMRSGSTLLAHILMSHPEVLGCGERNASYRNAADLAALRLDCYFANRTYFGRQRIFVDQVNHNRFIPEDAFLQRPTVKVVFLVRRPEPALASMADVLGRHYGTSLPECADYYVARLARLAAYARSMHAAERALCVRYESLVGEPGAALARLQAFLGLATELRQTYRVFPFTGRRGDPGRRILQGRICGGGAAERPPVPPEVVGPARAAYEDCLRALVEAGVAPS